MDDRELVITRIIDAPPEAVFRAWSRTADDVRRAYRDGIIQGWDLHPAQLPARYGALFATLREEIAPAAGMADSA